VLNSLLKEATTPTPPLAAPGSKKIYQRWWRHAPNENVAFGAKILQQQLLTGTVHKLLFSRVKDVPYAIGFSSLRT
jgi:hypothetical protein